MTEVILFLLGFTSITTVYEVTKTSKSSKSNSIKNDVKKLNKNLIKF